MRAMGARITCLSSMATRNVLAELAAAFTQRSGIDVALESVGGVDAARRVQAGERFDLVVLAAEAIDKLIAGGHLALSSRVDLVRSPVAVAVRAGALRPAIGSEAAVRQAVLAAPAIGFSTGPSGAHLLRLFERWGIAAEVQPRTVQAPPGVPVAALLARGEVALGLQQLSELMHAEGVDVLGVLPDDIAFVTVFAAGFGSGPVAAAATQWLDFIRSPAADVALQRHGMAPA
jgi:molybdate transport system substrate-binding protein